MNTTKVRKVQERTAITRELLLQAAEELFARVGYERAQVEQIAAEAGFSKGALYAHFKSKEDLFLALYHVKVAEHQAMLTNALAGASTRDEKVEAFRAFYIDLSKDHDWALIVLEVKLFVLRHPEVRARIHEIDELLTDNIQSALVRVFGSTARAAGEALGGISSALVLQSALEPAVLTERKMRAILGSIFDALLVTRT